MASSSSSNTTVGYRGETKVLYTRSVYVRRSAADDAARRQLLDPYAGKVMVLFYDPVAREAAKTEFDLRNEFHRFNLNRNKAGKPALKWDEFIAWHQSSPGSWLTPPDPRAVTQNQIGVNDWKRTRMHLDAMKVDYVGINGSDGANDALRALLWDIAGQKSFPLVFIDNACLGGADALKTIIEGGNFGHAFAAHLPPPNETGPKSFIREKGSAVPLGCYHHITETRPDGEAPLPPPAVIKEPPKANAGERKVALGGYYTIS